MKKFEVAQVILALGLVAAVLGFASYITGVTNEKERQCAARGGISVTTSRGNLCVRLEVLT